MSAVRQQRPIRGTKHAFFGAYICTYKLSTFILMGYDIPEICIQQIFRVVTQVPRGSQYETAPNPSSQWLLFVCGGMTDRKNLRLHISNTYPRNVPRPNRRSTAGMGNAADYLEKLHLVRAHHGKEDLLVLERGLCWNKHCKPIQEHQYGHSRSRRLLKEFAVKGGRAFFLWPYI